MVERIPDQVGELPGQVFRVDTNLTRLLVERTMQSIPDGVFVGYRFGYELAKKRFKRVEAKLQLRFFAVEAGEGKNVNNKCRLKTR